MSEESGRNIHVLFYYDFFHNNYRVKYCTYSISRTVDLVNTAIHVAHAEKRNLHLYLALSQLEMLGSSFPAGCIVHVFMDWRLSDIVASKFNMSKRVLLYFDSYNPRLIDEAVRFVDEHCTNVNVVFVCYSPYINDILHFIDHCISVEVTFAVKPITVCFYNVLPSILNFLLLNIFLNVQNYVGLKYIVDFEDSDIMFSNALRHMMASGEIKSDVAHEFFTIAYAIVEDRIVKGLTPETLLLKVLHPSLEGESWVLEGYRRFIHVPPYSDVYLLLRLGVDGLKRYEKNIRKYAEYFEKIEKQVKEISVEKIHNVNLDRIFRDWFSERK